MKIGLVGKAGVGKTTFADILVEKYGFKRLSFAKKLKEVTSIIFGRPVDKARDRWFLQTLGELARAVDSSVWIKHVYREMVALKNENIVIDDVRYLNEAEFLRDHGFILIRLYGRGYVLDPNLASHESETEQNAIQADLEVNVNVPLKDLPKLVDTVLKHTKSWFKEDFKDKMMYAFKGESNG